MPAAKRLRDNPDKSMIDQIIAGAERAFLASGYDLTTMDSVARHASVARGSVYNHFSSKEELFLAVMHRGTADFVERTTRNDVLGDPPFDRLHSLAVHFLRTATDSVSIKMYRAVVTQTERFPELSALFYSTGLQRIEMRFESILSLAQSELIDNPAMAAEHLLSLLMGGYFGRRLIGLAKHPADRSVENYVERAISSVRKNSWANSQFT